MPAKANSFNISLDGRKIQIKEQAYRELVRLAGEHMRATGKRITYLAVLRQIEQTFTPTGEGITRRVEEMLTS